MDPINVVCPACNAMVGRPCTRPTNTGRVPVAWIHYAREGRAEEHARNARQENQK